MSLIESYNKWEKENKKEINRQREPYKKAFDTKQTRKALKQFAIKW